MDLDLERIALGTVVGVTGATVAPGTSRKRDQKINFGTSHGMGSWNALSLKIR